LLLAGWILLIPAALAYHLGPGQTQKALDIVAQHVRHAEACAEASDHAGAVDAYEEALKALPESRKSYSRPLRIARAKAMMLASKLPEAHEDMKALVDELQGEPGSDAKLLGEAREVLANSQYYITWLMRLEGLGRELWEPEIDSARQNYRLLAEQATQKGNATAAQRHLEDLEASVRLARMDLGELQGLPLPSQ
jgi:hypothetical protein